MSYEFHGLKRSDKGQISTCNLIHTHRLKTARVEMMKSAALVSFSFLKGKNSCCV